MFATRQVGKTLVNRTQGTRIASDGLKGRVFEVSLADLQNDNDAERSFRKFKLIAEDVQGRNVLTNFHGMDLTTDKLRWEIFALVHITSTQPYRFFFCLHSPPDRWSRNGKHWLNATLTSRQLTDTSCVSSALASPPRTARRVVRLATLRHLRSKQFARRWPTSSTVTSLRQTWRKLSTNCCLIQLQRTSRRHATACIHCTMFTFAKWVWVDWFGASEFNAESANCLLVSGESPQETKIRLV